MSKMDIADPLHFILQRIGSVFRSEVRDRASSHGLKLVQLEALIYFASANRYSDTAGALAEYLGVTKGTASQTVMALSRRGLVRKAPDPTDGRVLHCHVTAQGHAVLGDVDLTAMLAGGLSPEQRAEALNAATLLLRTLQTQREFREFGQCRTCAFFRRTGDTMQCGFTGESLTEDDARLICREYSRTG